MRHILTSDPGAVTLSLSGAPKIPHTSHSGNGPQVELRANYIVGHVDFSIHGTSNKPAFEQHAYVFVISLDIPGARIRARYARSLRNLIALLDVAAEVHLIDNSEETVDGRPQARRVMRMKDRMIVVPPSLDELLSTTPEWAKPVVIAALKVNRASLATRRNLGR